VNTRISCKCVAQSRIQRERERDIWLNARRKAILCYSTQSTGKITFSVQTSKEDSSKNILVVKFYMNIYNDCLCLGYIHRRLIVITTNHNIYDHSFIFNIVTYSGFSIHDGTLLHSKSQYTTVKHSRKLLEHTYTSDPHGTGTLTRIEFFQQGFLWQSSNTHFHSCSQKASKHTSGQSIVGLSVHLHSTTAPRRIHQ
jgi:hypothetical protein